MKQKISDGSGHQGAARDIANWAAGAVNIATGANLAQPVSIGAVFAGPVHIHLNIDLASLAAVAKKSEAA